jgi:hypothetical protein
MCFPQVPGFRTLRGNRHYPTQALEARTLAHKAAFAFELPDLIAFFIPNRGPALKGDILRRTRSARRLEKAPAACDVSVTYVVFKVCILNT